MTESFNDSLGNRSEYSALLIDLFKVFTTLLNDLSKTFNHCTHNLIIAKLYVYDVFDVFTPKTYAQLFNRAFEGPLKPIVYGE